MQLTSSSHKQLWNGSGQKVGYYATILSSKNYHSLWSVSTAEWFMSSFLTSTESDFTFTPRMHKVLTGPNVHKFTWMPHWCSELEKCLIRWYLIKLHSLATQNGGVVSRFPPTIHFMFGYVRYCIKYYKYSYACHHSINLHNNNKPDSCILIHIFLSLLVIDWYTHPAWYTSLSHP